MHRRATIAAAATELFAAKGFSGTSIDEIGARAGISGPAIYRHFPGKDALLAAILLDTAEAFAGEDATGSADLGSVVAGAVSVALDDPARLVTYLRERHRLVGGARAALAGAERRLYRPWREAIRAANPGLGAAAAARRQLAALTAMGEVAARPQALSRPRLDHLLAASVEAVLVSPPIAVVPGPARPAAWSPPATPRDRIRAEALRLFRQRGYHGVGMDEIGEAAGMSGPSIYAHYDAKGAILLDAFERAGVRVAAAVHTAVTGVASASAALDRLAASHLEVAADDGDLIVVTSREAAALTGPDRPRLARRRAEVLDTWAAVVGELRPDVPEGGVRAVVDGVLPLVELLAPGLGSAREGVPLVRAWCLG